MEFKFAMERISVLGHQFSYADSGIETCVCTGAIVHHQPQTAAMMVFLTKHTSDFGFPRVLFEGSCLWEPFFYFLCQLRPDN